MRWNNFAGTAIIPTLARIILALAFVTAGSSKIFGSAEFNADQAESLRELGIDLKPTASTVAFVTLLPQDADPDDPEVIDQKPPIDERPFDDELDAATATQPPPADDVDDDAVEKGDDDAPGEIIEIPVIETGTTYTGGAINHLVLLLNSQEVPRPRLMAWIAALTEFAGGILILIGLFSRVWGLGLAITMGMAFYLTSMRPYFVDVGPFEAAGSMEYGWLVSTVFTQLGLGVLALTVFLVGPGPLSLDRLIFRPRKREEAFENVESRNER